ncbi:MULTISPECIES: ribosome maturation factor RimM [unclassified Clostridium]|uniref:ribosome maturation factor RimM n=1 Tax=unclassified Clostridium TaxID=2614128 RepID=UPI001105AC85|nr:MULTISPECIES: ribosome maturation factor RimM [unclassified Clostridium]
MQQYMVVGQVLKPQGIKGELKVRPITDDPDRFYDLQEVRIAQGRDYAVYPVQGVRVHEGFCYLRLAGVEDRNAAEALRDQLLYIDRSQAVKLPEGRYFICDLEGCQVVDETGAAIGVLDEVIQTGANDVYMIKGEKQAYMLPALKTLILAVDIEKGMITVRREGLMEVDAGAY